MAKGARLRGVLRGILPRPAASALRDCLNYARRFMAWIVVLRIVKGRTAIDAEVLRKSMLHAPLTMLMDLSTWREPQLVADAEIVIPSLGVFAIRAYSDDLGHVLPSTQAGIFSVMRDHIRPGDMVIDAGANIGATTVYLAQLVGPQGSVIAIEMMPDTAKRLRHNLALNGLTAVGVIEKALAEISDKTVTAEVSEGLFGQASIAARTNIGRVLRRVEVVTTTLDQVTEGVGEIALIKVDLEGAEVQALAGAQQTLKRTRALIFESWGGDGGRAGQILIKAGFSIFPIDGRNFLAARQRRREKS